jgi:hypothetical protein
MMRFCAHFRLTSRRLRSGLSNTVTAKPKVSYTTLMRWYFDTKVFFSRLLLSVQVFAPVNILISYLLSSSMNLAFEMKDGLGSDYAKILTKPNMMLSVFLLEIISCLLPYFRPQRSEHLSLGAFRSLVSG